MDHRDRVRFRGTWYEDFSEQTMIATLWVMQPDSSEELREIHCSWEVCPTCQGRGKHINPAIDEHGISPEQFAEDPDFFEDYMRGTYDVACYECGGRRVVPVPVLEEDRKLVEAKIRSTDAYLAEIDAERRMGA